MSRPASREVSSLPRTKSAASRPASGDASAPPGIDEHHVSDYFGGDQAMTEIFLEVLRIDISSGTALGNIAKKYFNGNVETARGFCELAVTAKAQCQEAEAERAEEESQLTRLAAQASSALVEKQKAKRANKKKDPLELTAQQAHGLTRRRATRVASAEEIDAVERALALKNESDDSAPPTPFPPSPGLEKKAAAAATEHAPPEQKTKTFQTKSVQDKAKDREKEVQRTMDLLRALENARLETGAGYVQLQEAVRPKSYTHELLKNAGLKYRRGKPVFDDTSNSRRSASALSYIDCHSTSKSRYREQGSGMAVVDRHARSTTPGPSRTEVPDRSASNELDTRASGGGSRGILKSWTKTLAPLSTTMSSSAFSRRDSLSISLPFLCKLSSSETAELASATRVVGDVEQKQEKLDADIDGGDEDDEPKIIANKRLKASKVDLARRIALGIDQNSILLSTKATKRTIEHHIILHDGEARDAMRRVEVILGEVFGVDIRQYGIPIRVTDSLREIMEKNLTQKMRLNAHMLDCAPRAACVKSEISLPKGMGRHMHSMAYFQKQDELNPESEPRPNSGTSSRVKLTAMDHQRRKVDASVARSHARVHRDVEEFVVLRGMSSYQMAGEIAKVVGSAFLFLEHYDGLDANTEGAFCELCSYLWAKEEKSQLLKEAGKIHFKIAELEGELEFVSNEVKILEVGVGEAHKEREEADAAELHAKKAVSAARDAVKYGWPGAQRKMEAAKQAEIDAARELQEAVEAEVKVIGKEYPEALERQKHVRHELDKTRKKLVETESAMNAYSMYMLTQENNPHPIYGEAFRKALQGLESIEGRMRIFLGHLKETSKLIQPRPKTKEELEAEEEERWRLQQAERDKPAEAQREQLGTLFGRITGRLKSAPPGAPGAAQLSHNDRYVRVPAEPAKNFEEETLDYLDDKLRHADTGELTSSELAEYCAMTIRGEHDPVYCFQVGEESLKEAKQRRFEGDLDGARTALVRATAALSNAGSKAREHLHELEYFEKTVTREWNQLQKASVCHELAQKAHRDGNLVVFRRYWNEAKSLYESCGEAGRKEPYLPALVVWDEQVKHLEIDVNNMGTSIDVAGKALEKLDMIVAVQQVYIAHSLIEKTGKAGESLAVKARALLQKVRDALTEQRVQQEAICKSAIVTEKFGQANNAIVEIWKCCRLSAVALGEVAHDAEDKLLRAAESKQAKVQGSNVVSLSEELAGTKEQNDAMKIIAGLDLLSWPQKDVDVIKHKEQASTALQRLTAARKHLQASASGPAYSKVLALQSVELDLALRVHSNDIVKNLLTKTDKENPNAAPLNAMPFMCTAAAANNTQAIELLMKVDGDVNLVDGNKNTPVHHAVMSKAWDVLKLLGKERKTNPNKINADELTPLHMAVIGKAQVSGGPTLKLLAKSTMGKGTGTGILDIMKNAQNKSSMDPYSEGVKILLSEFWKINPDTTSGKFKNTALHLAGEMANFSAQELLLKNSKTDPNVLDNRGRSPLTATVWVKKDISRFLSSQKVNVNIGIPKNGWSPLHVCIVKNSLEAMKSLLACNRVDVAAEDLCGFTPSHLALQTNFDKAINLLMASQAVQDIGGPKLMHLLESARRFHAEGDPAERGIWTLVTLEQLELLPSLLLKLRMWDMLHDTLCNISFAAAIVENLGVDAAIALFASVCEETGKFQGVQHDMCRDFSMYQNLLEKHSYDLRTAKTSFTTLAVDNHLWGVRNAQHTVAHIIEELDNIRGLFASKLKKENDCFYECLAVKHDIETITKLSLQKILPSKRSYDRASVFLQQLYKFSQVSLQELDDHFKHVMDSIKPDQPQTTIGQISSLLSVTKTQEETGALKVVMKNTIDISKIKSKICEALGGVVPNNEQHVLMRVVRVYVHMNKIVAIVVLSKNPVLSAATFAEGRLQKTQNAIIDSFRGRSNDVRLKPVIEELKILSLTVIDPSVFVVLDLLPPWTTIKRYKDKQDYGSQVLNDIRNACNLQPNLLRVCKVSENWNHVVIELLHDDMNPSKSLTKNRVMAERLAAMVYSPSTVLHKGAITQHVVCSVTLEGHVVPRFEGEWQDFHVRVMGSSMAMHNELEFLEDYILPAARDYAILHNCYLSWTVVHDDIMASNTKKMNTDLGDLELHASETEIVIGLVGNRFGEVIDSDMGKTSRPVRELQRSFLDCPDWQEVFVFVRDLEKLDEEGFPDQYMSSLSDVKKPEAYELLKQFKTQLDKHNGRRTIHFKPAVKGFGVDIEHVLSQMEQDVKKWQISNERLNTLKARDSESGDHAAAFAIKITENRMREIMESCGRWVRIVRAEDARGGVPSAMLDAVKEIEEHSIFADQTAPKMDLMTPDFSEVRLSTGLHLEVRTDMFHVGLAVVDSIKSRSGLSIAKPPFHSHLRERETFENIRISYENNFCVHEGSALDQTLQQLTNATCPVLTKRTGSVGRSSSAGNMERVKSVPVEKKRIVLLTGGAGSGKSVVFAVLSRRLLTLRYQDDPLLEVPNVFIYFKECQMHSFASALRYMHLELSLQLQGGKGLQARKQHMGDWEEERSILKQKLDELSSGTRVLFLLDGLSADHRRIIAELLQSLDGKHNVQCLMTAESTFPPDTVPNEVHSVFALAGLSTEEQEKVLSNYGTRFHTRDLTDEEIKHVVGKEVAQNPLYLQVYGQVCTLRPAWIDSMPELPEDTAKAFELFVIPFLSDWLRCPAKIIEAVLEVAHMNPRGIRPNSLHVEVQGQLPQELRSDATHFKISMVISKLSPIWRPTRNLDGIIAFEHPSLVSSLSGNSLVAKALHSADGQLKTKARRSTDAREDGLDTENADPLLLERLQVLTQHAVELFNLRCTRSMFLALEIEESWQLPPQSLPSDVDPEHDWLWAMQLQSKENTEEYESFHIDALCHSALAMDPGEAIVVAFEKWCRSADRQMNEYDLPDKDSSLTAELLFDATYDQLLKVRALAKSTEDHDFVIAHVGLQMACKIWSVDDAQFHQNESASGVDESLRKAAEQFGESAKLCLTKLRDTMSRIKREKQLLETQCEEFMANLVLKYRKEWNEERKFLPSTIKETFARLVYDLVVEFRGRIELLHRRATGLGISGSMASPWKKLSPGLIREACEGLQSNLNEEVVRITRVTAKKREIIFVAAVRRVQAQLEKGDIHDALDSYEEARACGRYPVEVVDKLNPNNLEDGLIELWMLKNQLDKACESKITNGGKSIVFGPAFTLEDAIVGIPTLFILQSKNSKGEKLENGGETDGWVIEITDTQGAVEFEITDNFNGTYEVEFVPRFEQGCSVSIGFKASKGSMIMPMTGSPFTLNFRRDSFWSSRPVFGFPPNITGNILFAASAGVIFFIDSAQHHVYRVTKDKELQSGYFIWRCQKGRFAGEDISSQKIKGVFALSETTFLGFTHALSPLYEGFNHSCVLLEMKEKATMFAKPLMICQQNPPSELKDIFLNRKEWAWANLSCKMENKVAGIPEQNPVTKVEGGEFAAEAESSTEVPVTISDVAAVESNAAVVVSDIIAAESDARDAEAAAAATVGASHGGASQEVAPEANSSKAMAAESISSEDNAASVEAESSNFDTYPNLDLDEAKFTQANINGSSHRYENFSVPILVVSAQQEEGKAAPVAMMMTHFDQYSRLWRKRSSAVYFEGKMIVFGGFGELCKILTCYDLQDAEREKATLSFETLQAAGHIPCCRCNFFLAHTGKSIFLHGGIDENDKVLNDIYTYDLEQHRWNRVLSISIPNPVKCNYACSMDGLLALHCGTTQMQVRFLETAKIVRRNSLHMCGEFIGQNVTKARRAMRTTLAHMMLKDSWLMRLAVFHALNRSNIDSTLQNVGEMLRFLQMHREAYDLDLTDLQEDVKDTMQMYQDMVKTAKDVRAKLINVPKAEAPHDALEICYRHRVKDLNSHDLTLNAEFALVSTGFSAATKAIERARKQMQDLRDECVEFEVQTNFFAVNDLMDAEKIIIDKQLNTLEHFQRAWELHESFFKWADIPLGHENLQDISILEDMKVDLEEMSLACDKFATSDLCLQLNQYLRDSMQANRFVMLLKLVAGKPEESWFATRIMCGLSQQILKPATVARLLQNNIMTSPGVVEFMKTATSSFDDALASVSPYIFKLCAFMKEGTTGISQKSMYSEVCYCEIRSALQKKLVNRSGSRFNSKPPRRLALDAEAREIIGKARMGKTKEFKRLLKENPLLYEKARDAHGSNLLHIAASNNRKKIIKELMRNDKIDLFARNQKGKNALDLALEFKYQELADYLREKLPALAEPAPKPMIHKSSRLAEDRSQEVQGIRIDFTLQGVYPGGLTQPGGSAYLRFGTYASFVSYAPIKIKSSASGKSEGDPIDVSAWFIVGNESGPWNFAYGDGFTEVTICARASDPEATAASDAASTATKAIILETAPFGVNLSSESADAKVRQSLVSLGHAIDKMHYSRSEFMAEFAAYSQRLDEINAVATRHGEEKLAEEQRMLANKSTLRDGMNRPIVVDGILRGCSRHAVMTTYHRDSLGRIVVPDGIVRNYNIQEDTRNEASWRERVRLDLDLESAVANEPSVPADVTDTEKRSEENDSKTQNLNLIRVNVTIPASPTTLKNIDDITSAGYEALSGLTNQASAVLIHAVSRGHTPLAYALRSRVCTPLEGAPTGEAATTETTTAATTPETTTPETTTAEPAAEDTKPGEGAAPVAEVDGVKSAEEAAAS